MPDHPLLPVLSRIAEALDRLSPPRQTPDLAGFPAYVWSGDRLLPVTAYHAMPLGLLRGVDEAAATLMANTTAFAQGLPANHALLWGARGMGKSTLVKAVVAEVNRRAGANIALVEVHPEDIGTLPALLAVLAGAERPFILFCDDLAFETANADYRHLKTILEGGLARRPDHLLFYATSNRRHLLPRSMNDNLQAAVIHEYEGVDETVSLSDRFGLWIGFPRCSQEEYLAMVRGYADTFGLSRPGDGLEAEALQWAMTRGGRSGRVAWQFIVDLAGRLGRSLELV